MLSKVVLLSRSSLPLLLKGSSVSLLPASNLVCRNYRSRTFSYEQESTDPLPVSPQEPIETESVKEERIEAEEAGMRFLPILV